MKVEDFITNYNNASDKTKFLSDCVVRQYIPYREKIADCTRVVNASVESNGIFKLNTPIQFVFFTATVITRYMDLEYDNVLDFFEKLDELNLINAILSKIPEREFASYNTILNMIQDDYMENNRSIASFIETKVKALGLSIDAIFDAIQKYVPQDVLEVADNNE